MTALLAEMNWNALGTGALVVLFMVVSFFLIITILIQRPQGGGLSAAFGSDVGAGQTAFGAKTGDALTTATIMFFVLFVGVAVGLNFMVRPPQAPPTEVRAPAGQPQNLPPQPVGTGATGATGATGSGSQTTAAEPAATGAGSSEPAATGPAPQ
ncbi:MAG: preprotein translocase subunit SecG [Phycisphaerales bacterium]|nr:preprotein translocase subunit SecG [Phycisphaerales bacterium]